MANFGFSAESDEITMYFNVGILPGRSIGLLALAREAREPLYLEQAREPIFKIERPKDTTALVKSPLCADFNDVSTTHQCICKLLRNCS